jgi:hypothetical protein
MGPGGWSPELECAIPTQSFAAPATITALAITHQTATITWPRCTLPYETLQYEVQLLLKARNGTREREVLEPLPTDAAEAVLEAGWSTVWVGKLNSARIPELESGCVYKMRVRAISDQGPGDWSPHCEVCDSGTSSYRR